MGFPEHNIKRIRACSPAKLNLFLHVTGRRKDGYHNIQTVFQLLNWGDKMIFEILDTPGILVSGDTSAIPDEKNLIIRAANALDRRDLGAHIHINKKIPIGGGMGGGSSNAATTLLALNHLWNLKLTLKELIDLSIPLGADVAVLTMGTSAWAEGIGEQLRTLPLPHRWYLILRPNCSVSTKDIFQHPELTRKTTPITVAAFFSGSGCNDLQPLVASQHPEVRDALEWLKEHTGTARLTGSGSCVFAAFESQERASAVAQCAPSHFKAILAEGIDERPAMLFECGKR